MKFNNLKKNYNPQKPWTTRSLWISSISIWAIPPYQQPTYPPPQQGAYPYYPPPQPPYGYQVPPQQYYPVQKPQTKNLSLKSLEKMRERGLISEENYLKKLKELGY